MMKKANKQLALHRKPHAQKEEDSPALLVKHIGKSMLITAGAGILLTLICSLAAYFYSDPDKLIRPLALVSCGMTALIGGFGAVRIHGHSALVCGLLNGSLMTAAMLLVSLFFTAHASGYSAGIACLLHAAFFLLSVAGAYIGLRRKPKKKKRF